MRLVLVVALVVACGPPGSGRETGPTSDGAACTEPPDPGARAHWRHTRTSLIVVSQGAPHHSARDPVVNGEQPIDLAGKFAYGRASKDLQDEEVVAYVQVGTCAPWREAARGFTDSDGRLTLVVDGATFPGPGRYAFQMVASGDSSRAPGAIYIVPRGRKTVVFDIDGTLTTGNSEVFKEILAGAVPNMRDAADLVAARYESAGYFIVYVTGRPYFLAPASRAWLAARGFPDGPLRTADAMSDALPTEGSAGAYKLATLEQLTSTAGIDFRYAYGNAGTDVCVYARAGIEPARTFIIGERGGEACDGYARSQSLADYRSHLPSLGQLPPGSPPTDASH